METNSVPVVRDNGHFKLRPMGYLLYPKEYQARIKGEISSGIFVKLKKKKPG